MAHTSYFYYQFHNIEVIGQGSFGVVLLAEYRGTKVAIKRILPQPKAGGSKVGRMSGSVDVVKSKVSNDQMSTGGSVDIESQDSPGAKLSTKGTHSTSKGMNSLDNMGTNSRSGSKSASVDDLNSELDFLGGLSFGGPKSAWAKWFPWLFVDRESRYNASILGTASGGTSTSKTALARVCPWFDANARRQQEFMIEMRLLSRLRHPCECWS